MVELRDILFENVAAVLKLEPAQSQQKFVEPVSFTIAMAYAGLNEGCPGFISVIYSDGCPVGVVLIGRSEVGDYEPEILQQYQYAYRMVGFFIDKDHQHMGIGKTALNLALCKLRDYPNALVLPLTLEVHKDNVVAVKLYEHFGFINTGVLLKDDNLVFVKMPCPCT